VTAVELAERIAALERELDPLGARAAEAEWMLYTTGEERWQAESARLDTEIRTILSRREAYEALRSALAAGGSGDPLLDRQAVLLLNDHRPNQLPPAAIERMVALEKALENRFNTFRAELDGERVSDNRIREVLEREDDVGLRRRAWEASKQIGTEAAPDLLDLVRVRNDAARALGFRTYYSMMLECAELDEEELFGLLERVDEGTRPLYERYKARLDEQLAERFGVAVADLRPWHYSDPFFQEAPAAGVDLDRWFAGADLAELTERYFTAIGFDVRDLLRRSDLYEREGKSQHAFCTWIDRRDDIRVLANVQPTEYWMATMLHELGHAVYDQNVDRGLPFFLRAPAHTLTTEASAMLLGRLSRNAEWLVEYAGMPEAEARATADALERARTATLLVSARWQLVMCHFERALYDDPDGRLNGRWWDLVERFQLVRRPSGRDAPDWAAKVHFSVAPAYYQNYLLGEMTASQLQAHLLDDVLGGGADVWRRYVTSREVGRWLRERLYAGGAIRDWRETIEHATGRPLDPEPFVRELANAV
jgi:peptidyl-dipeptidase A